MANSSKMAARLGKSWKWINNTIVVVGVGCGLYGSHFMYGLHSVKARRPLWQGLKHLASGVCLPWLILGDFNSLLHINDRLGSTVTWREIKDFQECIELGDSNGKSFYSAVKAKQDFNCVRVLYSDQGQKLEDIKDIRGEFVKLYSSLLGSSSTELESIDLPTVRDSPQVSAQ
ncbi:hypothetical protein RDABS01_029341 [Bienertia sinuspersici]